MVLYAASQTPVCLVLIFILIKPRDLLAFELILFICVLKFKLMDKLTSRYLAAGTFKSLSRTFDRLCRSEPVNLYLTSLYIFEAYQIACQFPAYFQSSTCLTLPRLSGIMINRNKTQAISDPGHFNPSHFGPIFVVGLVPILRTFRSLSSNCSLILRSFGPLEYSAVLL